MLGTDGSMWDALADAFGLAEQSCAWLDELRAASRGGCATPTHLADLTARLEKADGPRVEPVLISSCVKEEEALDVVRLVSERIAPGDQVNFDVTHGYRHLPLIALTALATAQASAPIVVEGVYYGALEMGRGQRATPVLRLDGYLRLLDWVKALAAYDASGDPAPLGVLIDEECDAGLSEPLAEAGFQERILNIDAAREPVERMRSALENASGVGSLFRKEIADRFAWTRQALLWRRQHMLAMRHLRHGAGTQAVLLLFEAAISREIERDAEAARNGSVNQRDRREAAKLHLENQRFSIPEWSQQQRAPRARQSAAVRRAKAFLTLKDMRNVLAHVGATKSVSARNAMRSRHAMNETLREIAEDLFGASPRSVANEKRDRQ